MQFFSASKNQKEIKKLNRTRKEKETVNHFTLCWVCQDIGLKAMGRGGTLDEYFGLSKE